MLYVYYVITHLTFFHFRERCLPLWCTLMCIPHDLLSYLFLSCCSFWAFLPLFCCCVSLIHSEQCCCLEYDLCCCRKLRHTFRTPCMHLYLWFSCPPWHQVWQRCSQFWYLGKGSLLWHFWTGQQVSRSDLCPAGWSGAPWPAGPSHKHPHQGYWCTHLPQSTWEDSFSHRAGKKWLNHLQPSHRQGVATSSPGQSILTARSLWGCQQSFRFKATLSSKLLVM